MYFYNPIVVRRNEVLESYFSDLATVAYLLENESFSLESLLLESLSNSARYEQMSNAARRAVMQSTWNNLVSGVINLIK
jgi:hypothetical protein